MTQRTKKKRQHYVPRFVLRRFSTDGRTISLLVLDNRRRVDGASLKEQCYRDYFYGKDPTVENSLADLEGQVAADLGDLSPDHLESLTEDHEFMLRFFAAIQAQRTERAAESLNRAVDFFAKNTLKHAKEAAGLDLSAFRVGYRDPMQMTMPMAIQIMPLLLDMWMKFLVADKRLGFTIGDHPLVTSNHFIEHHPVLSRCTGTGFAAKGLQIFMPLSPQVCLAFFDPQTYEYGSNASPICRVGIRDIRLLNTMQALTASNCIYFHPQFTDAAHLEELVAARGHHGPLEERTFVGKERVEPGGRRSQLLGVSAFDLRLGVRFSFVRVTDKGDYRDHRTVAPPIRSPELLAESERVGAEIARRRQEADANSEPNAPGEDEAQTAPPSQDTGM